MHIAVIRSAMPRRTGVMVSVGAVGEKSQRGPKYSAIMFESPLGYMASGGWSLTATIWSWNKLRAVSEQVTKIVHANDRLDKPSSCSSIATSPVASSLHFLQRHLLENIGINN